MTRSLVQSRRRGLAGVLLVSLALNAFFIGAAATEVITSAVATPDRHAGGMLYRLDLRWLDGRLPDAAVDKIAADVERGASGADRRFEHLRELRTDLGELVAVPTPDRAAINAKLADIRGELDRLLAETQAATVASVLALPAETRASLGAPPDPQG
jgi:Spy/CpxP family protein refolding chaperone